MRRLVRPLAVALAALGPGAAAALDLAGPTLGAASNFAQSWQPEALDGAGAIGLDEFRDEVMWHNVERDGDLHFDSMREAYPTILEARGAGLVLLVYTGHWDWEEGRVPQTPEGQAAFADYAARLVAEFPAIHSVEVGNEFNSHEMIAGEGWPEDLADRARAYAGLLSATAEAVRAVRPQMRILGGAAHSIPLAWLSAVMEAGGGKHMDALVLHPYTTEPEQLARQIALMRALPGLAEMPVEVTEFGTTDEERAPGYLMRMYCQMALSGVTRAVWYPFSPRGDGLIPLLTEDGTATGVGQAYAMIGEHLEGVQVTDAAPDPFTYACRFGERAMVIWGAPRGVALTPGLRALDATGAPAEMLELSREAPLLILSDDTPVALGDTVLLGSQEVLADSVDQYAYPFAAEGPGLSAVVRQRGTDHPFEVRPGQETGGVPWTPYLGYAPDGTVRAGPGWAAPSSWGKDDPIEIVTRYTAPEAMTVAVEVHAALEEASADGVTLTIAREGEVLGRLRLSPGALPGAGEVLRAGDVALAEGETVEVVLAPGANADGDSTALRVTVRRAR